jgi:hypothetical protein
VIPEIKTSSFCLTSLAVVVLIRIRESIAFELKYKPVATQMARLWEKLMGKDADAGGESMPPAEGRAS